MANHPTNYTLGRGKLYFSRFKPGTKIPAGEAYVGNSPEFNLTIESENLDHFASDEGIREKDDSVALQVTRTGSFTADDIKKDNLAIFFFGAAVLIAASAVTITDEAFADVTQGLYYQLGLTTANPAGAKGLVQHTAPAANVIVKVGAVTKAELTDYEIDLVTGRLYIVEGGGILTGDDVLVSYKIGASERDRIISGSTPVEGCLRFIAANPKGKDFDYYMPWVKVTPNGEFNLKGDDWQTIPFNLEILKPTGSEAILMEGRAVFP